MRKAQAQRSSFKVQGRGRIAHHFPGSRYAMGFTLIEVLIAMTLLSIMVVLLFSSLRTCAQSWEQGENKITEVNEVAVVHNFFQRHLSSAIPLWNDFNTGGGGTAPGQSGSSGTVAGNNASAANQPGADTSTDDMNRTFAFQGKKASLQFVSVFPASAGRSGMQLFSIEQDKQDGEQVIKVTITPFFPVTEGQEWHKEEVVLLRHVRDFTLAYFGIDEETGKSRWQDEWLKKNVQPQLVKIDISTANGVFWPEMIIELKVTGAAIATNTANGAPAVKGLD
jgi:general secretion pathway protein J